MYVCKDDCHGISVSGVDPSHAVLGGDHVNFFGDDRDVTGLEIKE